MPCSWGKKVTITITSFWNCYVNLYLAQKNSISTTTLSVIWKRGNKTAFRKNQKIK